MRITLNWLKLYRIISYEDKFLVQYRNNFWNKWKWVRDRAYKHGNVPFQSKEYCAYDSIEEAREALRAKIISDELARLKGVKGNHAEYF